jgi:catechol 2,3-dioxygenase-like lactoylglutathione lyase family enzyme
MNVKIIRLAHVSIFSKNLNLVKKFYIDLLKLKIVFKFKNKKKKVYGLFLKSGGGTLLEFFKTKKKSLVRGRINHFCLLVNSIKNMSNYLSTKKISHQNLISKNDKTKHIKVRDYENNIIEFHEIHDINSKISKYYERKK